MSGDTYSIPVPPKPWTIATLEHGMTYRLLRERRWIWACILRRMDDGSLSAMGTGETPDAAVLDALQKERITP